MRKDARPILEQREEFLRLRGPVDLTHGSLSSNRAESKTERGPSAPLRPGLPALYDKRGAGLNRSSLPAHEGHHAVIRLPALRS